MKRFIFLEGGAAVGKSSICTALSRNYPVHFESFVELCNEHKGYDPGGLVISFKWANLMISRMEQFMASPGTLFFFDRSFFTPFVFGSMRIGQQETAKNLAFYVDLMREVTNVFPCSVVLLHAQKQVVRKRLEDRYERSTEEEKAIRRSLKELDDEFIEKVNGRYAALNDRGLFHKTMDTSHGTIEELAKKLVAMHQ